MPSVIEIGEIISEHMSYSCEFIKIAGDEAVPEVGFTPWSTPRPFVLNCSAATQLGYVPAIDYRSGVKAMCNWLSETATDGDWRKRFPDLAGYSVEQFNYEAEDRFFAKLRTPS